MSRQQAELWSDAIGAAGTVLRYGHWGRPVLVFPAQQGRAQDFEQHGMIDAIGGLLDAGRVKLYCVDSYDAASCSNQDIPLDELPRLHAAYTPWLPHPFLPQFPP